MVTTQEVVDRLTSLGYVVETSEVPNVEFELMLIHDYIVNFCNFHTIDDIPPVLHYRIIDRVASEYLIKRKNAGLLPNFNYETAIKSIREGDTQIQFGTANDGGTPESRFDKLVDYMQRGFDKWLSVHRRIRW